MRAGEQFDEWTELRFYSRNLLACFFCTLCVASSGLALSASVLLTPQLAASWAASCLLPCWLPPGLLAAFCLAGGLSSCCLLLGFLVASPLAGCLFACWRPLLLLAAAWLALHLVSICPLMTHGCFFVACAGISWEAFRALCPAAVSLVGYFSCLLGDSVFLGLLWSAVLGHQLAEVS